MNLVAADTNPESLGHFWMSEFVLCSQNTKMSRAALWRQEGNVKERERVADESYQQLVEVGRSRPTAEGNASSTNSNAVLPIWGSDETFHFHPVLLQNMIHSSSYFQKRCCGELHDFNAIVDEIYYEVKHVTPFQHSSGASSMSGSASAVHSSAAPSTAFCLLLRLCLLRITPNQLQKLLRHVDSPYIRAIGFLYLRFVGQPASILETVAPFFYDPEPIGICGENGPESMVGDYVRQLFSSRSDYYGTTLPRYPMEYERTIQVEILKADSIMARANHHFAKNLPLLRLGRDIVALYGDETTPTMWYRAVIDRVIDREDDDSTAGGHKVLRHPKFIVTFSDYGNTETVHLGEVDLLADDSSPRTHWTRDEYHGWAVPGILERPSLSPEELYEAFIVTRYQNEKTTSNRNQYGRKPPSTKSALSRGAAPMTGGRGGRSGPPDRRYDSHDRSTGYSNNRNRNDGFRSRHDPATNHNRHSNQGHSDRERQQASTSPLASGESGGAEERKRSAEELASIAEKKRKLMARYG
jgi:pre-mRNA-splicing factor 38B